MLGATFVVGLVAVLSSALATSNNLALRKSFPGLEWEMVPSMTDDVFARVVCYRTIARIFYVQALFFWSLFGAMLIAHFLVFR